MHSAGIEVMLDVVYNHTAEGNHLGPTLSFKGIDNPAYYRLDPTTRATTSTTPARATASTCATRTCSSCSWTACATGCIEMHVDGFRFDLAATLARALHEVDRLSAFFDIIQQDPVISQVKLIAEPWDVGEGGYQVGNFPPLWSEWNGKYRDCVRDYWRGEAATLPEFAYRLTGSSDLYEQHAGATRREHQLRHLPRRLHAWRISSATTRSTTRPTARTTGTAPTTTGRGTAVSRGRPTTRRSAGAAPAAAQLPRDAAAVTRGPHDAGRRRDRPHAERQQQRLLSGQRRCPGSTGSTPTGILLAFVRRVGALRRRHPVFRRRRWFQGKPLHGEGASDIAWFAPTGEEMSDADWSVTFARCVGVFLNGDVADTSAQRVEQAGEGSFFLVLNAFWEALEFVVPDGRFAQVWSPVIDTARETDPFFEEPGADGPLKAGDRFHVEGRSVVLLGPNHLAAGHLAAGHLAPGYAAAGYAAAGDAAAGDNR